MDNNRKIRTGVVSAAGMTAYKKAEEVEEYISGKQSKKKKAAKNQNPKTTEEGRDQDDEGSKGARTKFVPLYTQDGRSNDTVLLPGRHPCECQAVKHGLVNNCLSCGRIICGQEGSGPCLFCGALVCTKEEQEVLNRGSKKSEQLLRRLGGDSRKEYMDKEKAEESYNAAVAAKNKLLEYDATSEKRTAVIDDESDYFNTDNNKWLTAKQREALKKREQEFQEKKHESRLSKKVTLDFAGRRVVEEEDIVAYDPSEDQELIDMFRGANDPFTVEGERAKLTDADGAVNPFIGRERPLYDEGSGGRGGGRGQGGRSQEGAGRVQDKGLQEMTDQGTCLSMHQPYASLLVMGAKIHEGRTWYSSHRGRLWIHAASKPPTDEEVKFLQNQHRLTSGVENYQFPPYYPTSCLLGSVDVEDCLAQEEYREKFPDGESASPFVFICTNPQELLIKFPMSGKHKLFKLEPNIHQAAKKTVKKSPSERGSGVMGL